MKLGVLKRILIVVESLILGTAIGCLLVGAHIAAAALSLSIVGFVVLWRVTP